MRLSLNATVIAFAAILSAVAPKLALADEYDSQRTAVKDYAMKARDVYKNKGRQVALSEFMTHGAWLEGPENYSLHIGVASNDETVLADSGFPELVGLNYNDISDFDGKSLGNAITVGVNGSPDGVSLPHRFANPNTKKVAHAEGYCMRIDADNILCAWSQSSK